MKVTAFHPVITTKDSENFLKLFEDLGFERRHEKVFSEKVTLYRMKDENGFYIDIVQNDDADRDQTEIRLNADNFDEAYDLLVNHGFQNMSGDKIGEEATSKGTSMAAPSGLMIALTQHIKNEK